VQSSRECTPSYLSTGISNLLQPAQAEVVLGQRSTYLASWVSSLPSTPHSSFTSFHLSPSLQAFKTEQVRTKGTVSQDFLSYLYRWFCIFVYLIIPLRLFTRKSLCSRRYCRKNFSVTLTSSQGRWRPSRVSYWMVKAYRRCSCQYFSTQEKSGNCRDNLLKGTRT
jgi:hypothetical protein